jgi:hypothetical protein
LGCLVAESTAWRWSSAAWFTTRAGPIEMDEVRLPLDPADRI